jgi:hypothetical protein
MYLKEMQNKTKRIVLKTEEKIRQKCAIKINFKYEISFSCTFANQLQREKMGKMKIYFAIVIRHICSEAAIVFIESKTENCSNCRPH